MVLTGSGLTIHRNKISRGTASAPLQTNAFCSKRLPSTFADSSVRPYTRKLSSPGHPLPGCCPMPDSKARLRCLSSLASAACRSALEAASKAWLNGFQAVKKALHCVLRRLWAASSSALACPTCRVKAGSAKTRYSVSWKALTVAESMIDADNKNLRLIERAYFAPSWLLHVEPHSLLRSTLPGQAG